MLYFIGLGLGDIKDISLKGLEIIKKCEEVYLESYTSVLVGSTLEEMSELYGKEIVVADRDMVETRSEEILRSAGTKDVAFLVVGDPFSATTHQDLLLRAHNQSVPVRTIHNASIFNAIGCTGLQLYNFGETVSIPFWEENWEPSSFFDKILENFNRGLHTLCLLDIKVKERSLENTLKGKNIFEPPRFMSCAKAADQLLAVIESKNKSDKPVINGSTECIGVARVGTSTQKLVRSTLEKMKETNMGEPLHSLIIIGNMHFLEEEAVQALTCSDL